MMWLNGLPPSIFWKLGTFSRMIVLGLRSDGPSDNHPEERFGPVVLPHRLALAFSVQGGEGLTWERGGVDIG
eukprot:14406492-Heterocapsa_arctica.AAC.1